MYSVLHIGLHCVDIAGENVSLKCMLLALTSDVNYSLALALKVLALVLASESKVPALVSHVSVAVWLRRALLALNKSGGPGSNPGRTGRPNRKIGSN